MLSMISSWPSQKSEIEAIFPTTGLILPQGFWHMYPVNNSLRPLFHNLQTNQ